MELIDKDKVVKEIERRIKTNKECMLGLRNLDYYQGKVDALNDTLSFIGTLEVKDVDLEEEVDSYINENFSEGSDGGMISDSHRSIGGVKYCDLADIARHFYELGLNAKKGE